MWNGIVTLILVVSREAQHVISHVNCPTLLLLEGFEPIMSAARALARYQGLFCFALFEQLIGPSVARLLMTNISVSIACAL